MIYGNQILCKSDFKMNFEQFIKWIKFKTDLWTFIQINILNDFDFHISLSDFSIKSMYWNHSEITQIHNYEYSRFKQRFVMTGGVPLSCPAPSLACPGTPWTDRAGWRCSGTWRGWAAAGWWSHCTPGYRSPPSYPCTGHSSGLHRGVKHGYKYSAKQYNTEMKLDQSSWRYWQIYVIDHKDTDRIDNSQ